MQYFKNCTTIIEVKSLYKKLAMEHHPDRGGDTATMQVINTEYAFACARLAKGAGLSDEEADTEIKLSEEYRQVIEKIINLPGIVIEVVGNWIWVTGNTRPVKDTLKAAGLFYASKKIAWYYRNEAFKTSGNNAPLEEIRKRYGSETIRTGFKNKSIEQH
ncbi:molecular chaperone DnaJ [Terrimonas sp.]|uniref:J domain-containing protein n=1 Tax=Terrimonas sp. TaxID=1914338 RepID=UPI000D51A18F|nr:J domain-containing protein [Terrimonas sp.]PVD52186.1 molecular chaperone DnaJ [Terrimonas sp.]